MLEHLPIIGPGAIAAFGISAYYIVRVLQGKQRLTGNIACAPFVVSPLLAALGVLAAGYVSVGSLNWTVVAWSAAATTLLNTVLLYLLWRKSRTHVFKDWHKWRRSSPLQSVAMGVAYLIIPLFVISMLDISFADLEDNECRGKCTGVALFIGNPDYSPMTVWLLCLILGLFFTLGVVSVVDAITHAQRKAQE